MKLEIHATQDEHTDIQIPDKDGNIFCIRFNMAKQLVHAKLHKNPSNSFQLADTVKLADLERFLAAQGSSVNELKKYL